MKSAKEVLAELEEKGFCYSVFYKGALCWGLPFGLLFSLVSSFLWHQPLIAALIQIVPLALISGAVFGWGLWGFALLQGVKS